MDIKKIPIDQIITTMENPNEMSDIKFNILVKTIEKVGYDQPIKVWYNQNIGRYEVVKGNHRLKALRILEYKEVDCIVSNFDERDKMLADLVKDNVNTGKISPKKFVNLVNKLNKKYNLDVVQEMFGFADEEEFAKLYKEVKKGLPVEMQEKLEETKKEIKTIDDLSRVLNRLFSEFGDTLDSGFMVIDYGGKDSIWVRSTPNLWNVIKPLADIVAKAKMDLPTVLLDILTTKKVAEDVKNDAIEKAKLESDKQDNQKLEDDVNNN